MSLINFGAGLSAMGKTMAAYVGNASMAYQKAEQDKELAKLASDLASTRETALEDRRFENQKAIIPIQGEEARTTAVASAGAQRDSSIAVQEAANKLPMTAAQIAENKIRENDLIDRRETRENTGWEMFQDDKGASYRVNSGRGVTQKKGDSGDWETIDAPPTNLNRIGAASNQDFTPAQADIMAALAERGVALPTGYRGKSQQIAIYKGLLERNPGKSASEIAEEVRAGNIELLADRKMANTVAGIAGNIKYAEEELTGSIPLVREVIGKLDRGDFVSYNKLMNMKDENISNPNLRVLKLRITSVLNAYDMLAARGGTDVGKREETHALLTAADSPEVLEAALDSFELEAAVAKKAARNAMRIERGAPPGAEDATKTGGVTGSPSSTTVPPPGAYTWTPQGLVPKK